MELRTLSNFLAVAREGSISAAARSLHISQPALSNQIHALEDELGKPLFVRGARGSRRMALTEEGALLQKRAEEIVTLVRKAEDELTGGGSAGGDVYIGAGETEAVRYLAQAAHRRSEAGASLRLHISSGNADYVLEYLDKGLLDFGLLFGGVDESRWSTLSLPGRDVWGVLLRRDDPLSAKRRISPQDLQGRPLITSQQSGALEMLARWLGVEAQELNVAGTYNLMYNASLLVSEGLGCAVCLGGLFNTARSALCFRPFEPRLEVRARLVWKRSREFSSAAKAFLASLNETLADDHT